MAKDIQKTEPLKVKIIRLVTGEEICCVLPDAQLPKGSNLVRLLEPMLIKYIPHMTEVGVSDYIALVKWVGFTDDKIISIPKDKIVTIANATAPFSVRYKKLVDTVNSKKQQLPDYVERNLSEEEYKSMDAKEEIQKAIDKLHENSDTLMPSKKIH
jgi:hypothetical protein